MRVSVLNPGHKDVVDRVETAWPLKETKHTKLYLNGSKGSLQTSKVSAEDKQDYNSEDKANNSLTYKIKMDRRTELTGYMKLHLWVSALDNNDMDLAIKVQKLDKDGKPIAGPTGAPIAATGYLRVSMRKLDPAKSTEAEPYYSMRKEDEQMLEKGKAYPVEIQIWPMGMIFEKGEYLQLTVGAYVPPIANIPFGGSIQTIPAEGMTYDPADKNVKMILLGGHETDVDDPAEVAKAPASHNKGRHEILTGGKYDSYLYVPVIK